MKRTTIDCNPDIQISDGHIYTTLRKHNFTDKEWNKILKDFNVSSKKTDFIQIQQKICNIASINHYQEGPTARKVLLKIDEQQAWFLTQLFENVFAVDREEDDGLFSSVDEEEDEDGNMLDPMQKTSFDPEFKDHISEVDDLLTKARGL